MAQVFLAISDDISNAKERRVTASPSSITAYREDAFRLSPDFQQEVERMVTTGRFDVSSLLEYLTLSDFAENYLREKNENHMAMAAWVKYGESAPEQVAVTDFVAALKAAYPQHSIVGTARYRKASIT